jgi:phosphoglycolate phosphatase
MSPRRSQRQRPGGLIFDLDGTLVDSFADIATGLNAARGEFGLTALPYEAVRARVGYGSEALVRALLPVAPGRFEDALRCYLERYEASALEQTRPYPGVAEVLARFGDRPLAVVTNKPQRITRRILEGLGLWERFRIVLGGDALERRKPDPLPVLRVLECFALPAREVVLVGDGLPDLRAGRAAGVCTVAVASGTEPRAALEAERPDHLIERLDELTALYD